MVLEEYEGKKIRPKKETKIKNKYSITGDILSYKLCGRQYAFFKIKGYQPSHIIQLWYGLMIHQVLDKLHMQFKGLIDKSKKNLLPTNADIEKYFNYVDGALKAKGIKAISLRDREKALEVLKLFNIQEGEKLYPQVVDSECNLQIDNDNFILHGIVDLLKENEDYFSEEYENVEIWDYKGSKFPDLNTEKGKNKLDRYEYQMLVYAKIYKLKNKKFPSKGILYFINELDENDLEGTSKNAKYIIDFKDKVYLKRIDNALKDFSETVLEIEKMKETDNWTTPKVIDKETCDICDLRWDCPAVKYKMRYP